MRLAGLLSLLLMFVGVSVAAARSSEPRQLPLPTQYTAPAINEGLVGSALSSVSALSDTVRYGGTLVDGQPDPIPGAVPANRPFKAGRSGGAGGGVWTFDTGVGSNFTAPTQVPKPAGYHHGMEGWTGRDATYGPLPYYRRSTLCALSGTYSMYAGVSLAESQALCYASGQGYGNSWNMTIGKTFNYPGTGNVTLAYRYQVDSEQGYDYLNVIIDTTATGVQDDVQITSYDGVIPNTTASHNLMRGITMRSNAGPVTIKFNATSDDVYSDEDGNSPTVCGHSSVDNIQLSGSIVDFSDFEADANGWLELIPIYGPGGDWSDLRSLNSLPAPLTFCACALSDTVLVFADLAGGHNSNLGNYYDVDNYACSPWIDLLAGGDVGRRGKLIQFSGYFELPLTNYIFVQTLAAWYPSICPNTGIPSVHPPTSDGFIRFYEGGAKCATTGSPISVDFSAVIPAYAEQVKICVGVMSICSMHECTGVTNSTPWFDNVSLCVFGPVGTPIISQRTIDVFQDNFASDGTLNPVSTGRIDVNLVKGSGSPQPGTALGDTLVVNGDAGNQEVRVVFHVRPGPFTNATNVSAWGAAKWTAEPGLGAGWYSARCDSSEQGGVKSTGRWMSTLHELDPKFGGGTDTDRGGEGDFTQLSHDMFPDHLLTAGSRIDYFVKARFLPPDPRNPGGTYWYISPDTTGGRYLEIEILPSSFAADTTWNCTLYVDHHADRDFPAQLLEEQGLTAVLGSGGTNAEGTKFDRYDVQAPSSAQASLGRPLNTQYGASVGQTFAYKVIAWHSGNLASVNLVDEDANNLAAWLAIQSVGNNRLWLSGDGIARSMTTENEASTVMLLNNLLGVRYTCDSIRLASCPSGSPVDTTYCLPLAAVAGSDFATTLPVSARGNGCPEIRSFDLISANSSVPTAKGQLAYQKSDGVKNFASVTNHNISGVDYETVVDGVAVGWLRNPTGNPHNPSSCNVTTPAVARTSDVIGWFRALGGTDVCKSVPPTGDDEWVGTRPPEFRTRLGAIYPNPMNPTTRIRFTNGREGDRVRLSIFDVTGRLVRTLLDAKRPAGPHDLVWDGRDDGGQSLGSGMYFVRLTTWDTVESKKVVVAK